MTPSTRRRLQAVLERLGRNESVSLAERIELQKFADRDRSVADWLRQARRRQAAAAAAPAAAGDSSPAAPAPDGIDRLLEGLNLGASEPDEGFRRDRDDLGDWFGGAPGWLRRS